MLLLVVSGFSVSVNNSFAFNHLFPLKSRNRQKEEEKNITCASLYREIAWKAVKVSLDDLNEGG